MHETVKNSRFCMMSIVEGSRAGHCFAFREPTPARRFLFVRSVYRVWKRLNLADKSGKNLQGGS